MLRAFLPLVILALAGPTAAQTGDTRPVCDGEVQVFRVSKLKAGASIADFEKVVAQHMAWYRRHGYTANDQLVGRVITPTGFAPDQVATVHTNMTRTKPGEHDAEWDAFVAAYRRISDIVSESAICLPRR